MDLIKSGDSEEYNAVISISTTQKNNPPSFDIVSKIINESNQAENIKILSFSPSLKSTSIQNLKLDNPLGIEYGGTGAITQPSALENLGIHFTTNTNIESLTTGHIMFVYEDW